MRSRHRGALAGIQIPTTQPDGKAAERPQDFLRPSPNEGHHTELNA